MTQSRVVGVWAQRSLRIQIIALSLKHKYPYADTWALLLTAAEIWERRHGPLCYHTA